MPMILFTLDPTTQSILIGLMLLWGLLLFGGFAYGLRRGHHPGTSAPRIPRELRLGSSLCLAVAAWIWSQTLQGADRSPFIEDFALWFALGASLSCLGDFIVILVRAEHAHSVGLLAFMPFLRAGIPITLLTLLVGVLWLMWVFP